MDRQDEQDKTTKTGQKRWKLNALAVSGPSNADTESRGIIETKPTDMDAQDKTVRNYENRESHENCKEQVKSKLPNLDGQDETKGMGQMRWKLIDIVAQDRRLNADADEIRKTKPKQQTLMDRM